MSALHKAYQGATTLLSPLIEGVVRVRSWRGKEDKERITERWGRASCKRDHDKTVIWIHAISVGEASSALSLITLLQKLYPQAQLLMTTGTMTSAQLMARKLPPSVVHQYIPVDTPKAVRQFLETWNPRLALWVESELWPNMLYEIKKRGIPFLLLNGRMSETSYRWWMRLRPFIAPLLKAFSWCGVQSLQQKEFFENLGAQDVEVMPNLKLLTDIPTFPREHKEELEAAMASRPAWFASCTHEGEEEMVMSVHERLLQGHKDFLLFLAPRHTHRKANVLSLLEERNLTFQCRSDKALLAQHDQVYVVDTMGELGLFYSLSPMTFMGGTWAPKGGHNPIEAAQMGSYVFYGPHIDSNQDLYRLLEESGVAHCVKSEEDLYQFLLKGVTTHNQNWEDVKTEGLEIVSNVLKKHIKDVRKVAC